MHLSSNYPVLFCFVFLSNRHDLIKKLYALKDTNSDLAGLLLEQVLLVRTDYGKHLLYYTKMDSVFQVT